MDELLPALPRDETHATRMEGSKTFRTGRANVLLGAQGSLAETRTYAPADPSFIVDGMAVALRRRVKARRLFTQARGGAAMVAAADVMVGSSRLAAFSRSTRGGGAR